MTQTQDHKIGVMGLGKLGLPLAAVLADTGVSVIGYDIDTAHCNSIAAQDAEYAEPGLTSLYRKCICDGTLQVVNNITDLQGTTATFIIVPTPSNSTRPCGGTSEFTNKFVVDALKYLKDAVATSPIPYMIVIVSTVMPGSMESEIIPAAEACFGKPHGDGFVLYYNPEFIALGQIIHDLQNPPRILIGAPVGDKCVRLVSIYTQMLHGGMVPFNIMRYAEAEITKIATNSMLTAKITYANMISDLCERFEDVDVDTVTAGIGADPRIGSRYLRGGLGYGGPCFPRDNLALQAAYDRHQVWNNRIFLAIHAYNREMPSKVSILIRKIISRNKPNMNSIAVGIVGAAYKQDTLAMDDSQACMIMGKLGGINAIEKIRVHQPGIDMCGLMLSGAVSVARENPLYEIEDDLFALTAKSDVIVLPVYSQTLLHRFQCCLEEYRKRSSRKIWIIDCWRQINNPSETVIQFGRYHPIRDTDIRWMYD
jgi:UDPglucose 6-dehydrogenase